MPRRSAERRQEEILAATLVKIEELGLSAVRVKDVADALGVSSALVHYHFESKETLIVAAFTSMVGQDLSMIGRLARDSDPVRALARFMYECGPTGDAQSWRLWIEAWAGALRDDGILHALREGEQRWRDALQGVLDSGVQAGHFRCEDPAATAQRLGGLIEGLAVCSVVYRRVSRTQMRAWLTEAAAAEVGLPAEVLVNSRRRGSQKRAV